MHSTNQILRSIYLLLTIFSSTSHQQETFITRTDDVHDRVQENALFDITQLSSHFSLYCWGKGPEGRPIRVYWSINNHYESNGTEIQDVNIGWKVSTGFTLPYRKIKLFKDLSTAAVEGIFRCTAPRGYRVVRILHPILSISIAILNIYPTNTTFKVVCISSGGRPVRMSVSGPSGVVEDNMNIVNVGRAVGTGNDSFTSNTTVHDGRNGDTYTCFASNGISNASDSMVLSVPSNPIIDSVTQTSETSVRVEWSQPSGGSTVTGYVVHYSDGISEKSESVPASSTTTVVSDLTNCHNYSFSVEATSEHLSGISDTWRFELGASTLALNIRNVEQNSTSVLVQWSILRQCSGSDSENGAPTLTFRVQYTVVSSGEVKNVDITGEWNGTETEIILTGLTPYTNYSIQIARVNEEGDVGPYSHPVYIQTNEDVPGPVVNLEAVPSHTQVTITWTKPLMSNGVLTSYEVSYEHVDKPVDSEEKEIRVNTTRYTTANNLKENRMYNFSVRAYTRAGPGNLSSVIVNTLTSSTTNPNDSHETAIIFGTTVLLCGLIFCVTAVITSTIIAIMRRKYKNEVAVEDNPAYGAVVRPKRKQVSTTKQTPPAPAAADVERRNYKNEVAVEDNLAYGAVVRPKRKQVSTTKQTPPAPTAADAEYEMVTF